MIDNYISNDIKSTSSSRLLDEIEKICNEFSHRGISNGVANSNINHISALPVEVPRSLLDKIDSMLCTTPLTQNISENLNIIATLSVTNQHKDFSKLEASLMNLVDLFNQSNATVVDEQNYHSSSRSSRRDSTLSEMETKCINEMKEKDVLIADLRAKVEIGNSAITALSSATHTESRAKELESKLFSVSTEKDNLERQIESHQLQHEHLSKQVNDMNAAAASSATALLNENIKTTSTAQQTSIVSELESTIEKHLHTIEGLENSIHLLNETIEQYEEKCSVSLKEITTLKLALATLEEQSHSNVDVVNAEKKVETMSITFSTATANTIASPIKNETAVMNNNDDVEDDEIEVAEDMDENEYDDDDEDDDNEENDDGMALFETVDALRRRVAELEMWLEIERAKNSPMKQIKLRQLVRESFLQPNSARKSSSTTDAREIDCDHNENSMNGNISPLFKQTEDHKADDTTFQTPIKTEMNIKNNNISNNNSSSNNASNNSSSNNNNNNNSLLQERNELKAENALLIERSIALYDKVQELQSIIDSFRVEYAGGVLSVPLTTVLKSPRSSTSIGGSGSSSLLYNNNTSSSVVTSPRSRLVTPRVTLTTPRIDSSRMSSSSNSNNNTIGVNVSKTILKNTTTPSKNNNSITTAAAVVDIDKHRFYVDTNTPIVYIEIGSFYSRVGMWNWTEQRFEIKFTCRTCQAVAVNDKDRYDIVRHAAASQTDDMYQNFRERGYFIGSDAIYCCFDHPDRGLRSSLKVSPIIVDGCITDMKAFEGLLEHCLERGAMRFDANNIQLLLAYKLSYSSDVMENIVMNLFEELQCASVCLLSEASLVSHSVSNAPVSAIIVDIGAYCTTVVPIYENMIIQNAAGVTAIGGEHITEYLTTLLYAQQNETYNGLMPRRCKEIARQIKENCCYVAESFLTEQQKYGTFEFQSIQVMGMGTKSSLIEQGKLNNSNADDNGHKAATSKSAKLASTAKSSLAYAHKQQQADDIRTTLDCALLDGSPMFMTADIERFHCSEIFFQPNLYEECRYANSLIDVIIKSILQLNECVQSEICCHVILGGGSSCIPGLATRLQTELTAAITMEDIELPSTGVKVYTEEENPFKNKAFESFAKAASSGNNNNNNNNQKNGYGSGSNSSSPTRVRAKSVYVRGSEASESDVNCTRSAVLTGATARVKSSLKSNSKSSSTYTTNNSTSIAASNFILSSDYDERGASELIQDMMCY